MSAQGDRAELSGVTTFVVWVIIVVLGVFSLVMRYAHIGGFTFLTGYLVASIQATLVGLFFMDLYKERATIRLALGAALVLLAMFIGLSVADVLTRATPPLSNPPGTAQRYFG